MATNKVQITMRFEEKAMLKLTMLARKDKRSFNGLINHLAMNYLEEYEKQYGEINLPEDQ